MWRQGPSGVGSVRHPDDQAHRPTESLGQRSPLQLRRSELRLKVEQAALEFDEVGFNRLIHDQIARAAIWRRGNRYLQLNPPPAVRLGSDGHRQPELS